MVSEPYFLSFMKPYLFGMQESYRGPDRASKESFVRR